MNFVELNYLIYNINHNKKLKKIKKSKTVFGYKKKKKTQIILY